MNKFRIGDRVHVTNEHRGSYGLKGTITGVFIEHDGYNWNVLLDRHPNIDYTLNLAYLENELELDKNSVVINILNDL